MLNVPKTPGLGLRLPLEEPIVNALFSRYDARLHHAAVGTQHGIEGIGITAFGGNLVTTLKAAVGKFGNLIVGDDPLRTEVIAAKLRAASVQCLPGGIATPAMSAIDIALWDIRGMAFNAQLYKLLGGSDSSAFGQSSFLLHSLPDDQRGSRPA